jgi:hypothetical protein
VSNGRNPRGRKKIDTTRDSGGFVALPWSVLDSAAYRELSHPARSLLLEIARQYVRDNNGRLLASKNYLKPRGWCSADVITRAKRELIAWGFIHETVKGRRPNRASWYAVTWYSLDPHRDYDAGAAESFERGAYKRRVPENTTPCPSRGTRKKTIAPSGGIVPVRIEPSDGAVVQCVRPQSAPSEGNHLDMPSAVRTPANEPAHRVLH